MILVFGSINADLIVPVSWLPQPGETVLGGEYALLPGGKGANQALAAIYIAQNHGKLAPGVYDVPENIDKEVARLKLESLGVRIDQLTEEQRRYLASWDTGT